MTHIRMWRFRPPTGQERDFAAAYDRGGTWAELFARAPGFRGTTLLKPAEPGGWWLTIDRWTDAAAFETFQVDFGHEYRRLDVELEEVAGKEEFVGAFEERD